MFSLMHIQACIDACSCPSPYLDEVCPLGNIIVGAHSRVAGELLGHLKS